MRNEAQVTPGLEGIGWFSTQMMYQDVTVRKSYVAYQAVKVLNRQFVTPLLCTHYH